VANSPVDPRIEDLVRVGKVRISVFPPEYTKDPATGELRGWAVDLARALAARIGTVNQLVEYPGPQPVLDDLKSGACDVAARERISSAVPKAYDAGTANVTP
jgi:polar amino acid transport system substrate-binding protein